MAEVLFSAKIPLTAHRTKKNSYRVNRSSGKFYKPKKITDNEEELMGPLRKVWADKPPICQDIEISFTFCFAHDVFFTKKGSRAQRVGDLDNLLQLPLDCLQKAGIIKNDSQVMSFDGSRKYPRETTYIEIEIKAFNFGG